MIPISTYKPNREAKKLVNKVLKSGNLVQGHYVDLLEACFQDLTGVGWNGSAVAVANGTIALEAMLRAYDVGTGDIVITNPLSFIATRSAIEHVGATPIFASVNEDGTLEPNSVHEAITQHQLMSKNNKVIVMPVDLHGKFDHIMVDNKDVLILRDSCQAHGLELQEDSHAAAFSLHASKNMTSGEGGIVVSRDRTIINKIELMRNHGMGDVPYVYTDIEKYNWRMTDLQAAVGVASYHQLLKNNYSRCKIALTYNNAFQNCLDTPPDQGIYHHYMLRHPNRDMFVQLLRHDGIDARVYYPKLLEGKTVGDQSMAEKICAQSFAIPVHPYLKKKEIKYIINSVLKIEKELRAL